MMSFIKHPKHNKITIGFDASRALSNERTGTENYSCQILKAIASFACKNDLRLYTRGTESICNNTSVGVQSPISFTYFWTQVGLMQKTWTDQLDVLFIPAHVIPFFKKPTLPTVVTVHDIRTEFLPQHSNLLQKFYLNTFVEQLRGKLATHLIAVSEATKLDVIERLGIAEEKITVIYEGVDRDFFNPQKSRDRSKIIEVTQRLGINNEYLLYVGTVQPRKNLARLIEAYSQQIARETDINLVIAGKRGWLADEIYTAPMKYGVENRVKFVGYVTQDDLPYLYAGAKAFVFPSLYEGFGLPILEALSMGTPVLTSNISSMPEVGGDLVTYVDPNSTESIIKGLSEVLLQKLDWKKIDSHLAKFTWEDAGKKTYDLLYRIAQKQ